MTELLVLDSGSGRVWNATGSAVAPLITGLVVYAIATTAYILTSLHHDQHGFASAEEKEPTRSSKESPC
jgi:hypothetical protein